MEQLGSGMLGDSIFIEFILFDGLPLSFFGRSPEKILPVNSMGTGLLVDTLTLAIGYSILVRIWAR